MHKVLLTDNISPEALTVFEAYPDIEAAITGTLSAPELKKALADCEAVIVRSPTRLTAEVLSGGRKLRFIGRAGVGVDNIDLKAAGRQGVVVMNAAGANAISTAEFTMAMILSLIRRIPRAHQSMVAGRWERKDFKGMELCGRTLGIIGLGKVGSEVARRAGAFGMNVMAVDPAVTPEAAQKAGARLVALEDLLRDSDIISLHVPLVPETVGIIGEKAFNMMKKGAFLVNCARGRVVDESALESALRGGRLAGAALDVYAQEPPEDSPLAGLEEVVLTPHIGGMTGDAHRRIVREICTNIAEALRGGEPRNVVTVNK